MPLIWQKPFGVIPGAVSFMFFSHVSITISGDSAAYFYLKIIILISLKSTMTQTRTKLDRVTFPCKLMFCPFSLYLFIRNFMTTYIHIKLLTCMYIHENTHFIVNIWFKQYFIR